MGRSKRKLHHRERQQPCHHRWHDSPQARHDFRFVLLVPTSISASGRLTLNCTSDTGAGPTMHVDPRIAKAYYSQVAGAIPTAKNSNGDDVSYKFPCDSVMPNLNLGFSGSYSSMSGRQMTYNDPDPDNSKFHPASPPLPYFRMEQQLMDVRCKCAQDRWTPRTSMKVMVGAWERCFFKVIMWFLTCRRRRRGYSLRRGMELLIVCLCTLEWFLLRDVDYSFWRENTALATLSLAYSLSSAYRPPYIIWI